MFLSEARKTQNDKSGFLKVKMDFQKISKEQVAVQ